MGKYDKEDELYVKISNKFKKDEYNFIVLNGIKIYLGHIGHSIVLMLPAEDDNTQWYFYSTDPCVVHNSKGYMKTISYKEFNDNYKDQSYRFNLDLMYSTKELNKIIDSTDFEDIFKLFGEYINE